MGNAGPLDMKTLGTIERRDRRVPAPGRDVFLRETHALLRQLLC